MSCAKSWVRSIASATSACCALQLVESLVSALGALGLASEHQPGRSVWGQGLHGAPPRRAGLPQAWRLGQALCLRGGAPCSPDPTRATWLVLRREAKRTEAETQRLDQLHAQQAEVAEAIDLTQDFAQLMRQRQPDALDPSCSGRPPAPWRPCNACQRAPRRLCGRQSGGDAARGQWTGGRPYCIA